MDYAGGGPVEIGSGLSALAYSMVLGRRQEKMMLNFRPHNVSLITLGTVFLWFGWLGFNGGSAFGSNLRATMACWNTNLTANFAAITWVMLDWRLAKKWSMVGWCSGAISGLVAATPASGYITPWASVVLGIATGVVANFSTKIKYWIKIDDAMDVFAEHGVRWHGRSLLQRRFWRRVHHRSRWRQHRIHSRRLDRAQLEAVVHAGGIYRCLHSVGLCYERSLSLTPSTTHPVLHLRASEEAELLGMDDDQLGEFAYDYVEVRRDYLAWTPAKGEPDKKEHDIAQTDRHGIPQHSEMLEGHNPEPSEGSGAEHTGIAGDRHGVEVEKSEREKDYQGHAGSAQ